ncbi:serine hydrolase domain-containing protein [Microbacterium hominis]
MAARRRRVGAALAAAVVLAIGLAACSGPGVELDGPEQVDSALPEATVTELSAAVENAMTAAGASGAIIGVWAPWSGTWVSGFGTQRPGGGAEVTEDMTFRAARIGRPMTCDVLYRLVADGRVKLDAAVSDYVGGVADLGDVTLEQLCNSTSGIGAYQGQLQTLWLSNPERRWQPLELASYGLGQERKTEPGQAYRDSDAGYVLLGLALERATGKTAAELIEEYVAEPLALEATRLSNGSAQAGATVLAGAHSTRTDGVWNCTDPIDATPVSASTGFTDSGIVTDIDDLGRYAQALSEGVLMPEGTDRWDSVQPAYNGAPAWYTIGGGTVQAGALTGQFGAVPGYITAAFADDETGLTVAVVLNNSAAGGGFGAYLAWELAAIASKAPATGSEPAPAAGLPWTPEQYHDAITDGAICAPAE